MNETKDISQTEIDGLARLLLPLMREQLEKKAEFENNLQSGKVAE